MFIHSIIMFFVIPNLSPVVVFIMSTIHVFFSSRCSRGGFCTCWISCIPSHKNIRILFFYIQSELDVWEP
jgi:hypothetical protein